MAKRTSPRPKVVRPSLGWFLLLDGAHGPCCTFGQRVTPRPGQRSLAGPATPSIEIASDSRRRRRHARGRRAYRWPHGRSTWTAQGRLAPAVLRGRFPVAVEVAPVPEGLSTGNAKKQLRSSSRPASASRRKPWDLPWHPRSRRPHLRFRTRSCRPRACRWPSRAARTPWFCEWRTARWP